MNIHGGDIYSYTAETGRMPLDFSANINPYGLPEGVRQAVINSLSGCCHYPDVRCRALRRAVSLWEQVPEESLSFGNGAADIIFRLTQGLRPASALLPAPTFHEYEAALFSVDCTIAYYDLDPFRNFAIGEDILSRLPKQGMVFLCNPNNPTGALTPCGLVKEIAQACLALDTVLVVDECFLDFVEDPALYSAKPFLQEFPNLVILKAFTKLFAMPGLRLGYCLCADPALHQTLASAGPPWAVSVPAQAAGIAACMETEYVARSVSFLQCERQFLSHRLKELGLRLFPGGANFILFQIPPGQTGFQYFLAQRDILVRSCANYRGLDESYFRVAVRLHEENLDLLKGISLWLAQL